MNELDDLIDSLEISGDVSHQQMEFLYTSEANNNYWIELDVSNYSITEYINRKKENDKCR